MDELYPQKSGDAWVVRTQLMMQLAAPPPYDLDSVDLAEYKGVQPPFDRWSHVANVCGQLSDRLLNSCEQALRLETSTTAGQVQTKIDTWRDARAEGQILPPVKLPGLDT
ncbi:hypothetical protein [Candidatus Methylospira mobilis]|nr:hypothetical protein [Candidatus Methylospira mobilis]